MYTHEIIAPIEELSVFFSCYTTSNMLVPSHWHEHLEVIYLLDGSMEIIIGDRTVTLIKGDMFIINSGLIHLTKTMETTRTILLQVPFQQLAESIPNIEQLRFKEYFHYPQKESKIYPSMVKALLKMQRIFEERQKGYSLLFNSYLNEFLYHLYVNYSYHDLSLTNSSLNKHRHHLKKAIDYIQAHYNESLTLKDISSYLALNPEYFCRMFKKNMGFTFLEYINQIRLTKIYDDIMTTDDSITSLQEKHGFTNYKVFNRMFKESYGCTPSKARIKTI